MGLAVHFLWSYGFTFGNNNIEGNVMPCGCGKGLTSSVQLCLEFHGVWLAIGVGLSLAENLTLVRFFFCERGWLSALSNGTWNKNLLYGLHLNG